MVICRVISRIIIVTTDIRGLRTPLITTHEPPSSAVTQQTYVLLG